MKHGTKKKIAIDAGVSSSFVSYFFRGKKIPSWKTSKKLGAATGTDPVLWAEGRVEEIKTLLSPEEQALETQ